MAATCRKCSRTNQTTATVPHYFSLTDASTWHLATVPQLCLLGNKSVMTQRLHDSIHPAPSDHSSGSSTSSTTPAMQSN